MDTLMKYLKIIRERGLSQNEIESLINDAEDSAQDILVDRKRKESDRNTARDVIRWIRRVRDSFNRKGSIHPNAVNALRRVVTGVKSGRYGFMSPPDGRVPDQYSK